AIEAAPGAVREGESGASGTEREGRGRRGRRRRGNRGEPRAERAPVEGGAPTEVVDALTGAMPEPRIEKPGHAEPIEKARPATPQDSDSAPPIASPFHAAAAEAAAPIAVAPSEHIFAPVEAAPEAKPQKQAEAKRTPPPAVTPRPIPELPPVSLTLPL